MVVLYLDINLFLIVVSPQLEQKGKLQRPIAKDVSEESCISLLNVPFFGGEFLFFSYLFFFSSAFATRCFRHQTVKGAQTSNHLPGHHLR